MPPRQHADLRVQSGYWPAAVGHQRDREQHDKDAVEQRVERGSVAALGHRHPARPGWQPDGAGPQPVQDRTHRWEVAPGQRPETATQTDDFEQHRVEHSLLEHDRFRPPGCDIGEAAYARRGPGEQPAAEDVQRDLHAVHHMHDQRGAEPVLGDVACHRHDPLGARALAPLGHVDDGQVGLDETHCSSFDKPGLGVPTGGDERNYPHRPPMWKRHKLRRVLSDPDAKVIVVEHRDRLARFGVEHLEAALSAQGRRIVVAEPGETTDDLVRDMIEVLTSMCARLYGRRGARNRAMRALTAAKKDPGAAA